MKSIILSILTALLILNVNAQVVPNPSFEDWTPSGSEPPFDWEEPTDWKSNNATVEFVGAVVNQTTDVIDGDAAVIIHTTSIFGETVPGVLVNGNPSVDYTNYSVNFDEAGTSLSEVTDLPFVLEGSYKFISTSKEDMAYAVAAYTKFNTATNQLDTTALGSVFLSQVNNYSFFTINMEDLGTGLVPDNVVIAFYSSYPENPFPGGQLFVDGINFISLPSSIAILDDKNPKFTLLPNPVATDLSITFEGFVDNYIIQISSAAGQQLMVNKTSSNRKSIDLSHFEKGIYMVEVFDEKGQLLETQRIMKL